MAKLSHEKLHLDFLGRDLTQCRMLMLACTSDKAFSTSSLYFQNKLTNAAKVLYITLWCPLVKHTELPISFNFTSPVGSRLPGVWPTLGDAQWCAKFIFNVCGGFDDSSAVHGCRKKWQCDGCDVIGKCIVTSHFMLWRLNIHHLEAKEARQNPCLSLFLLSDE